MPGLLLGMLGPLAVWAADCSSLRGFARVAPWSAWPPSCGGQSLLPCRPPAERRAGGALSIILAGSAPGCAPPATVGTSASSFVSGLRACDVSRGLSRAPPGSFVRGSWLPTGLWLAGPLTLCPYWLLRARHSPSRVLPFEPIPALLGGGLGGFFLSACLCSGHSAVLSVTAGIGGCLTGSAGTFPRWLLLVDGASGHPRR